MQDRLTKLILIEDDPGHARLISKQLKSNANVEVLAFTTGRKALVHILEKSPAELRHHVIVLDINLPGIDGFEVLRRVRANAATALVPVIMLTTTDNGEEVRRCYHLGANLYLTKPMFRRLPPRSKCACGGKQKDILEVNRHVRQLL